MAIYSGFSHWKWWFSIVMLVYQRVNPLVVEDSYWTWNRSLIFFSGPRSWLNPTSVTFECQSLEGVCGWLSRRANTGGGLGRAWGLPAHFQVIFVKSFLRKSQHLVRVSSCATRFVRQKRGFQISKSRPNSSHLLGQNVIGGSFLEKIPIQTSWNPMVNPISKWWRFQNRISNKIHEMTGGCDPKKNPLVN